MGFEMPQGNKEKLAGLESTRLILLRKLEKMSMEINHGYRAEKQNGNLLDQSGRIKLIAFQNMFGRDLLIEDGKTISGKEKLWAGTGSKDREEYYKGKFKLPEDQAFNDKTFIECWERENEEKKAGQIEMLVTLLLHANLKDRFLVVRSSKYDDYEHGVDNLIIDKKTGEVICAFDEVVESEKSGRIDDKKERILNRARSGGSKVRYGATFKEGNMVLESLSSLPLFYLSLTTEEIDEILVDIQNGGDFNGDKMKAVVGKLMDSLLEQSEVLQSDNGVKGREISKKIDKAKDMALTIKALVSGDSPVK